MAIAQFSGLASGIDSQSLIDAIIEARGRSNELRKQEIEFLESENEAYDELSTKIANLNSLLERYRTLNGGGVAKRATSSDSAVAAASVNAAASKGSYTWTATTLAATATASFNDTYTSTSSVLAASASGTQTIGVTVGTGGSAVTINTNITNTTTVQQFVDAFNGNTSANGKVTASIVNVGSTSTPSYKVVFTSLTSGMEEGSLAFSVPVMTQLQTRTVNQATDASFSITGIGTITRSSNTIGDVISGVTFNLTKTGTATINIADDTESAADQFQEVVDAYNDIVEYVNENNTVSRNESGNTVTNVYGTLAKSRLDDDFLTNFRARLSAASTTAGTSVTSFSEVGLSTNRDGTLSLDIEKFKSAVASDSVGAQDLFTSFADNVSGTGGFFYEYTKFQGFIDIAKDGNNSQIENLNDKVSQLERQLEKVRANYTGQFARLEWITAQLQQKQQELSSVLSSLG